MFNIEWSLFPSGAKNSMLSIIGSTYHSMTNRFTNNAQFILLLLFCIYRVLITFRSIEYVTRFRLGTT